MICVPLKVPVQSLASTAGVVFGQDTKPQVTPVPEVDATSMSPEFPH